MALSKLAETLIGSEIIKLAAEVNEKIRQGRDIYNYTIGDFDPEIFPIPLRFEQLIREAYANHQTNYPAADGILELRKAVAGLIKHYEGLDYKENQILISGGGRPLIYAIYRTIVDKGDKVIYAAPSWNNNHYTHFVDGEHISIETLAENKFMPTSDQLREHIHDAVLLALCSPLNPTGTAFSRNQLLEICEMVAAENKRRGEGEKKLYILFDQIYWLLTFGETQHFNPVSLCPELKDYTIFVDGMSKAFASTGIRVGWSMGPEKVIAKMKSILSHVGAWSPMPEQKAAATFLTEFDEIDSYLKDLKEKIYLRLTLLHEGFQQLKQKGFAVDSIAPEAAIYLTVKFALEGMKTPEGKILKNQSDVCAYILNEGHLAVVPFYAFGASPESPWYRLSVGTCKIEEIPEMFTQLEKILSVLR
jgi:aspartate aminotransferase